MTSDVVQTASNDSEIWDEASGMPGTPQGLPLQQSPDRHGIDEIDEYVTVQEYKEYLNYIKYEN